MRTWSGGHAPLPDNDGGTVDVIDLVIHKGRTHRFGGWGDPEWTVLHHSQLCAYLWLALGYPKEEMHWAFMHDDAEVYTGDIPGPVKRLLGTGIKKVEAELDQSIRDHLRLEGAPNERVRKLIKWVDFLALVIESAFFGPPRTYYDVMVELTPAERGKVMISIRSIAPTIHTKLWLKNEFYHLLSDGGPGDQPTEPADPSPST